MKRIEVEKHNRIEKKVEIEEYKRIKRIKMKEHEIIERIKIKEHKRIKRIEIKYKRIGIIDMN